MTKGFTEDKKASIPVFSHLSSIVCPRGFFRLPPTANWIFSVFSPLSSVIWIFSPHDPKIPYFGCRRKRRRLEKSGPREA